MMKRGRNSSGVHGYYGIALQCQFQVYEVGGQQINMGSILLRQQRSSNHLLLCVLLQISPNRAGAIIYPPNFSSLFEVITD